MVYCTKCGTKNEDTALVCIKCGASLETETHMSRRYEHRYTEAEWLGLPHGRAIVILAVGILILLWGFWDLMHALYPDVFPRVDVWPLILIVFGILLILSALYRLGRRPLS